jgi:hypothetical protein
MNNLNLLIPFFYFRNTRLNNLKALAYHVHAEWLASLLILFYFKHSSVGDAVILFLTGYACFICVYEVGYIANDTFATKSEDAPRLRMKENLSPLFVTSFVLIRVAIFGSLAWWLMPVNTFFFLFYVLLIISFALHNLITNRELKIMTFINLATARFLAPFVFFIPLSVTQVLMPSILLFYVFYRALNYMDSKNLLILPSRKTPSFKVFFYLLLVPVAILLSVIQQTYVPLWAVAYFASFWLMVFLVRPKENS